eukprot:CAMPEP_0182576826 /NCGR_PEP_ID=MMETSP1324-20130603/35275_1 /TAXON_ID=236786 /ORGANISM="Florenciella sp., Strain RCC1587" /LENGTH=109 /DNA_ID=CAMNT_0024792571 /DNA_START=80 /DNA_END=407 /DNA_ORIENTATION=-
MAVNLPRRSGVLDLHFQSARTCVVVLEALLDQEMRDAPAGREGEARKVWVVTGTGHHTGNTHVKAGRLLEATEEWLGLSGYDLHMGRMARATSALSLCTANASAMRVIV